MSYLCISWGSSSYRIDMLVLYAVVFWVQVGEQSGGKTSTSSGSIAQQQATRKVTRMCITIATTFTVAWMPYQLNRIVMAYGNKEHAFLLLEGFETLTFVNSCVNPIVYSLMWKPFRQSLIKVRLGWFYWPEITSVCILRFFAHIDGLSCNIPKGCLRHAKFEIPHCYDYIWGFPAQTCKNRKSC